MKSNNNNPLIKMISRKTIALDVEVHDWESAVKAGGKLLVEAGSVEERYVDAMIDTVKSLGPYVVIAPGVALPHARPEDGVKEPCMSLITLRNPINFGNKNNDPVKLVVSFGTIDKSAHIGAIKRIARIIGDPGKLEEIKNAERVEVIERIIAQPI
jgi:mannitol operon transcriptional antiterminator